jgi:hypothetical protein
MKFDINNYPEYRSIEGLIRRARAERSVVIATMLANAIDGAVKGLKQTWAGLAHGVRIERDVHALQVDALFRKPTPRY